ncbi:MAG: hypothetical protein ACOC56_00460 [Atribacterota bacterium]
MNNLGKLKPVKEEDKASLKEKVDELYKEKKEGESKKMKLPRKAKVSKGKLKKGWIGVLKIDENGNLTGEKHRILGSCFNSKENYYYATDGREVLFWDGKFPVVIQPSWKINPLQVRKEEGETNETYGQPYIKARLMADVIKIKSSKGAMPLIWLVGLIVGGYILYSILTGGI